VRRIKEQNTTTEEDSNVNCTCKLTSGVCLSSTLASNISLFSVVGRGPVSVRRPVVVSPRGAGRRRGRSAESLSQTAFLPPPKKIPDSLQLLGADGANAPLNAVLMIQPTAVSTPMSSLLNLEG